MHRYIVLTILFAWALAAHAQNAPQTGKTPPLTGSNVLNPNISVVGNFLAYAGAEADGRGHGHDHGEEKPAAFELSEAELGIQAAIDPYAKADVFIGFHAHEVELEEAYVTWLRLPAGLGLKMGKFRAAFGKFNLVHPPETHFPDRPLAHEEFLGGEGLAAAGVQFSYSPPTSLYLNFIAEVTNVWDNAPAFGFIDEGDPLDEEDDHLERGGRRRSDLGYLGRAETYFDLTESQNLSLGLSHAASFWDEEAELRSHLSGFDATYRWKNPRRAIYRSVFWQTEVMHLRREMEEGADALDRWGGFTHLDYQFARRWHAGARADYTREAFGYEPDEPHGGRRGGMLYAAFAPSEFSLLGLYGRAVRLANGETDHTAFFRLTFSLGPHGAHPF
ncbi:MAG: hypothetical protein JSV08_00915 [Acidobacteriota bacterium]|nr:MAG: hypothetical protein JSV08_00915 [Acidobacteriota bacterium]